MTKKELIESLSDVPDDMIILISSDSEGNDYHKLRNVCDAACTSENNYQYEIHIKELTDELRKMGYDEEDVRRDAQECIVLYP